MDARNEIRKTLNRNGGTDFRFYSEYFLRAQMSKSVIPEIYKVGDIYLKDTLVKGKPAKIECVDIDGQSYSINRGPLTILRLEDEWFEDVHNPTRVIETLKGKLAFQVDLFTFWQRLPNVTPQYTFPMEFEDIAVLPIQSFDHWWNHQIKGRVRNLIRKSEKEGLVVRETSFDDDFVRGMTTIFNESPIRQGRRFWHFGKDFDLVKQQFSRYLHRESMIGAYYNDEMIGLMMLGNAGSFALTGQIISSLKHRDKLPNNALIAKAVEICANKQLSYLCYLFWSDDSLAEFKRRCGFEKTSIPRYFVPLTAKGRLGLKCGVHHGWVSMLPEGLKRRLKVVRKAWNQRGETD